MNKINFEKLFSNDAKGHATLIKSFEVHPRPIPGNMTGCHANPPAGGWQNVLECCFRAI